MPQIGVQLIFGAAPEPFLEAALLSVQWADYFCVVNTAPDDGMAAQNEATVRRVVPRDKLRLSRIRFPLNGFSFGRARNAALELADPDDYVLRLDADEVHYPELQQLAEQWVADGRRVVEGAFYHLICYKDLVGEEHAREFFFRNSAGVRFPDAVHEQLVGSGGRPQAWSTDYRWVHYGYIKPPREIFRRWQLYAQLEGEPDRYQGRNPDDILEGWSENCAVFWREHPPAVQQLLESYPSAPRSARTAEAVCNVGLVMLTWDDAERLKDCLASLAFTRQPFELFVVDNASADESVELAKQFGAQVTSVSEAEAGNGAAVNIRRASLATALNVGFGHFLECEDIDYIGWIHPDMVFDYPTWLECLRHALDMHPEIVKVGAMDINTDSYKEPVPGNTQCYLVRKSALQQVGLFNEGFQACGGYEDWEMNFRLQKLGKIMIWPQAKVRHYSMSTRSRHDNQSAAHHNGDLYFQLTGTRDPVV